MIDDLSCFQIEHPIRVLSSSEIKSRIASLSYSQIDYLIDEWIHNGKHRAIAKCKLHNKEITFEQLAEKYGYSVNQAKNIVKEAKITICSHI